jgi:hypothetical protein
MQGLFFPLIQPLQWLCGCRDSTSCACKSCFFDLIQPCALRHVCPSYSSLMVTFTALLPQQCCTVTVLVVPLL